MKSKFYKVVFIVFLAMMMFLKAAQSQSCSGEIVHFRETFGSGTSAASLPVGRTNYIYNSGASLADGDYRLHRSSQGRPEWHNSNDHTGNANGRMMITNASYAPGEFYRDTVWVLNSNTFYSVYLYVMNLNQPTTCGTTAILPNLEFVIESYNALLGTFSRITSFTSGYIDRTTTGVWRLTGGYFTLPAGVTAVRYRIINNSTGGCGNDLAIDDITFAQCLALSLPVRGMNMKAEMNGSVNTINWSTQQEMNTDKFVVEKSADGKSWSAFSTVAAAGNSNSKKMYKVEDATPYMNQTFYRIKQIDLDGQLVYSTVEVVKAVGATEKLAAYPNPFTSTLKIELNSKEDKAAVVRISDINGKHIKTINWQLKKGTNNLAIDNVQQLTSGVYFAEIISNSGESIGRTRLVKM